MSKLDEYESRLPIREDWEANFELTLDIRHQVLKVQEKNDILNNALDDHFEASRKIAVAELELKEARKELQRLRYELADRERLLRKEMPCER